jgi:hypothetical protein
MKAPCVPRVGFFGAVVALALAAGCVTTPQPPLRVCPGKATVAEALATLEAQAAGAVSFRANAQCLLTYHVSDSDKEKRNNVPMQIFFSPPSDIYIQGSIGVDPKAVIIGSNDEEFWLALRPKEMSRYYEGRWDEVRDFDGLMLSPKIVLEAFGLLTLGDSGEADRWSLSNEGPFDILTRTDETGHATKRLYVYACDYRVHKIEYLDETGTVIGEARLIDHEPVTDSFSIPTRVEATLTQPKGLQDCMKIDLNPPKVKDFNERQRAFMFTPQGKERAEQVFRYLDGRWVPQQ